jgi:hypothetical protein
MRQTISPYLWEGFLILSLDYKWNNVFEGLSFKVFVDKQRRLCIVSQQCLKK